MGGGGGSGGGGGVVGWGRMCAEGEREGRRLCAVMRRPVQRLQHGWQGRGVAPQGGPPRHAHGWPAGPAGLTAREQSLKASPAYRRLAGQSCLPHRSNSVSRSTDSRGRRSEASLGGAMASRGTKAGWRGVVSARRRWWEGPGPIRSATGCASTQVGAAVAARAC